MASDRTAPPAASSGVLAATSGTMAGVTADGTNKRTTEVNITARAGGGKGSATALSATATFHYINTCATAADSILAKPALAGFSFYLYNGGAAAAQVFGQGTDTINGIATGTGISLPAGQGMWFVAHADGTWTTSRINDLAAIPNSAAASGQVLYGTTGGAGKSEAAFAYNETTDTLTVGGNLCVGGATDPAYGATYNGVVINASSVPYVRMNVGGAQRVLMYMSTGSLYSINSTTGVAIEADGGGVVLKPSTGVVTFGSATAGSAGNVVWIKKPVSAIPDATGTATFTVTVPNAAHSARLTVRFAASLGAGGAVGANEASASIAYDICITRTAGVNAVATISSGYGSSGSAAVAGATTCAVAAALSAISGAVGATNTFTVNVTVTKGGGSSANHTCQCFAELHNANAAGVTIA